MKRYLFAALVMCFCAPVFADRPMRILVYMFENQGAADHSWIAAGMTEAVISDLAKISSVAVITDRDRRKALKELEFSLSDAADENTAVRIGQMTGADTIFSGSYTVVGAQIRVVANLISVESGVLVKSIKLDGTLGELFALEDRIVLALMDESAALAVADVKKPQVTAEEKSRIEQAREAGPEAYEWYARGLDLEETDPQAALEAFRKALKLVPDYTDALLEAGYVAYDLLDQFEDARGFFESALRVLEKKGETDSEEYADGLWYLGDLHLEKQEYAKAIEHYGKASGIYERLDLRETEEYASLQAACGNAWLDSGDFKRALSYFEKAKPIFEKIGMKKTAEFADLLFNIGAAYLELGNDGKALDSLQKAKSLYENLDLADTGEYAEILLNIAWVYEETDRESEAGKLYRKACEIFKRTGYDGELEAEAREGAARLGY